MTDKGDQKGPQQHAEGQQGEKTHRRFQEQLEEGRPAERSAQPLTNPDGGHRLFEGREQHDEAERNSEKNRLGDEADRGRVSQEHPRLNGGVDGRS